MATILRWILPASFGLIAMLSIPPTHAQIKQIAPNQEYKTKATFLLNFAKFTMWPKDVLAESDRLQVCILGTDPFGLFLDVLAIREVRGHKVDLQRLKSSDQADACHLLFLATDAVPEKGRVPAELTRRGLFVVADTPGLAERGVTANLLHENGDLRFEINVRAARQAALILNTQLLRLGRLTKKSGYEQP